MKDLYTVDLKVREKLDPELVKAVCPKGWMLDFTEHNCCEKRRLQDAAARVQDNRRPRRRRDLDGVEARQKVRCRRLHSGPPGRECWRVLGFSEVPSRVPKSQRGCQCGVREIAGAGPTGKPLSDAATLASSDAVATSARAWCALSLLRMQRGMERGRWGRG